jgi:hypothetical protein
MPKLILQPRAAPPGCLRLWVCASSYPFAAPPQLQWKVNGAEAQPTVLRMLEPVLPAAWRSASTQTTYTGVYEFKGPAFKPDQVYAVEVSDASPDGPRVAVRYRTLPEQVPPDLGDAAFNVLLVSCFHAAEDRGGLAGEVVSQLKAELQPNLTLLMGDQVYLDLPTMMDFKDGSAWLARHFEQDYLANWTGETGYRKVLAAAPSVSIPDDHEYWNNYPHVSPFIENTYSEQGRRHWTAAARRLYDAFQQPYPEGIEQAVELNVEPLAFFMLDTRTFRRENRSACVHPAVRQQFSRWVDRVIEEKQFGVIVSGQSWFDEAAKGLNGAVGDRTLANYADYPFFVGKLEQLAKAGRPVLCLTGDVHWGRVFEAHNRFMAPGKLLEVISSPSSLVSTTGKDQIGKATSWVKGLFGKADPWPRHADALDPPSHVLSNAFDSGKPLYKQKGNHVVVLSFRRSGFGLKLQVVYQEIRPAGNPAPARYLDPISLSPGF